MNGLSPDAESRLDALRQWYKTSPAILADVSAELNYAGSHVDLFPLDANNLSGAGASVGDQSQNPSGPPSPLADSASRQPDSSAGETVARPDMSETPGKAEQPAAIGPCPSATLFDIANGWEWTWNSGKWIRVENPERIAAIDRTSGPSQTCANNFECLTKLAFPQIPEGEPVRWIYRFRGEWTLERIREPGKVILIVTDGSFSPAGDPKPADVIPGEAVERPTLRDKEWVDSRPISDDLVKSCYRFDPLL